MNTRLHIFGSCSGTEPFPGRHHCSFALEHNDRLYWFDAGENCSFTAHVMGLNLKKIRSIFISHPHMDHVGGLGNLLWNIRKLHIVSGGMDGKNIDLFMPNEETYPALLQLLKQTEGDFEIPFTITNKHISDGVLLDEDGVKVEAMHNLHLPQQADGSWRSYSFRITVNGKIIAFSGDVGSYAEIQPILRGADVILAETGHHRPAKVCRELIQMNCIPRTLLFIHHGRALLDEGDLPMQEARGVYDGRMIVLNDGDTLHIDELTGE